MHVLIIGAGALGTIYAAYLSRAGHDVTLFARGERANIIREYGIAVSGIDEFVTRCAIATADDPPASCDVLINAVKTYDNETALHALQNVQVSSAFSVQNGVQKNIALSDTFGSRATLGAVGMLGGEVTHVAPGEPLGVRFNMPGGTTVGELDGSSSARVDDIVTALSESGLRANSSTDIQSVEWSKFVGWSGVSALAVLTRLPTSAFMSRPDTALLAGRVMRETAAVARAHGISLQPSGNSAPAIIDANEDDALASLLEGGQRSLITSRDFRQSILQDADRGKPLEVDETLGYTLALARQYDIDVPTLDLCCRILRVISETQSAD